MCGIAGFIDFSRRIENSELRSIVQRMSDTLVHRGPDNRGIWVDVKSGIAFGHRRLSIIDLSPQGHQPMHSASGRYIIAFNGEIYNHNEIRKELEFLSNSKFKNQNPIPPIWRGHSDTEVILAAIEAWGVESAVKRFVGMFALALWDREEKALSLVRDRLGEKPLYYGWMGNTFLFGSELKALKVHPEWRGEINRDVLVLYLRHNYIPAPYSIYKGIYKLMPGTIVSLTAARTADRQLDMPVPYWSAREIAEAGVRDSFEGSEQEAAKHLEALLKESVRQQMVADVPLGASLSGGIDSSTIVALMQIQSSRPVKTFTIGFYEDSYNEAENAKAVAHHLGTEHAELYVTPEEAMAVIQRLPILYDEPFSDSSQIPTYLISKLTRQYVTVSLSGDGGDELFAGYNRYFWCKNIWQKIGWMPLSLRKVAASVLTAISPQGWDRFFNTLDLFLPSKIRQNMPGDKLHKLSEIIAVKRIDDMYLGLISHWKYPETVVIGGHKPLTILADQERENISDFIQDMMYFDMMTYLPDDILVKIDRASMGVGLESRAPFLDHRVVEFAWRLPLAMKIRNGQGKWLLRQVLYKYVPKELVERPKMGFGVPIDSWLRGPLREWAENLLNEKRLREEEFFNPEPIREKWHEHLSGRRNWQYHLWDVLMFQAWLETQGNC